MCEKSERPSRAWFGLENTEFDIVRQAWASGHTPGCRGTHRRSLNFVLIVPMTDSSTFSWLWDPFGLSKTTVIFFSLSCFFNDSFCFLYTREEEVQGKNTRIKPTYDTYKIHLNLRTRGLGYHERIWQEKKNAKKITIWFYYNSFTPQYEIMHGKDLFRRYNVVAGVKSKRIHCGPGVFWGQ